MVGGLGDLPDNDALIEGEQNEGKIDSGKLVQEANRKTKESGGFSNVKKFGEEWSKRLQGASPHTAEDSASHHGWQGLGQARLPPSSSLCSRS